MKVGHRRFLRPDIRRLSFTFIAQKLGVSQDELADEGPGPNKLIGG